ncbi:MAG: glycosyl hydrolase family 88 [Acholeplasma sp.]|jgi:unsaturated rhamnogalacturonyl hydrolase|nr:MAG: glycosyl hydrolase family 88 [Acholeplasma sp.]
MYPIIQKYIERLVNQSTPERPLWNIELLLQGKKPHWNYIDGCMMISLIELYRETNESTYIHFVKSYIDTFIDDQGHIKGYDINHFNLDDICESRVLFDLYDLFKEEKYQKAIHFTYQHILHQPRTYEGNFWHKKIYPNQVWLDGLFMAQPFYARYISHFGNVKLYDDILNQFKTVHHRMFNTKVKLYYHGYDASKTIFWADPHTGTSKNFWLRAIGWYIVSLVDVYAYMDYKSEEKEILLAYLKDLVEGLLTYQDQSSHMFYQVVNLGNKEGNYLETSGSALISYALLKGVRLGMLPKQYQTIGLDIFDGIVTLNLNEKDGQLQLGSICLVAGLGPENDLRRDGSYSYYISEPIVQNDAKGVGPLIMAYTEVIRAKK